jgi:hypothetical protein
MVRNIPKALTCGETLGCVIERFPSMGLRMPTPPCDIGMKERRSTKRLTSHPLRSQRFPCLDRLSYDGFAVHESCNFMCMCVGLGGKQFAAAPMAIRTREPPCREPATASFLSAICHCDPVLILCVLSHGICQHSKLCFRLV